MKKVFILLFFIFLISACAPVAPAPTATLTPTQTPIQYADEVLPGAEPERFGENFFGGSFHSAPVISPDGSTMWWAGEYGSATIYSSTLISSKWSEPAIENFSEEITSYRDPFISPDGSKFYFISENNNPNIGESGKENIWMMNKTVAGWSEPQPLPELINTYELHWTISVASNYDLYFSAKKNGNWDIFVSRYIDGAYSEPIKFGAEINTNEREFTPNIASDGSYLLFSRNGENSDIPYLYITYPTETGWTEAVKIENISYCLSPIVTPDRKYVIFLSSPSSFGWRDTTFIEEFRP